MQTAIFIDRDGVLIRDRERLTRPEEIEVLEGVAGALTRLKAAGHLLLLITNQPVVARGLCTLEDVDTVHARLGRLLSKQGAPPLDGAYVCPHHPHADLDEYRIACDCRKPRPGLILRAARERDIDLAGSFVVGDRLSDVAAGAAAGCRTVQVLSGKHADPPIVSPDPVDSNLRPDHVAPDLSGAADWILGRT